MEKRGSEGKSSRREVRPALTAEVDPPSLTNRVEASIFRRLEGRAFADRAAIE